MEWDEGSDELDVAGNFQVTGPTQLYGALSVGVDDLSHDVTFFGATASAYMKWNQATDDLQLAGDAGLVVPDGQFTLGSTAVTATAAELNIIDAGATVTTPTVAGGDAFVMDDLDVGIRQVDIDNVDTYLSQTSKTLTNKTLTSPTMTMGSDATGDIYYRAAGGALTRLATGADGTVLTSTGAGAVPAFEAAGGITMGKAIAAAIVFG